MAPAASYADVGDRSLSFEDETAARDFLSSYSVTRPVQNRLIAKMRKGEVLDSDRGSVAPVSQRTIAAPDDLVQVNTYSDGSIAVLTTSDLEAAKARAATEVGTRGVSACIYSSGGAYASYWRNCVGKSTTVTLTLAFRFNYSNTRDIGSRIDSWCCEEHSARGGTFSGSISRLHPRVVRYSGTMNYYADVGSATRWMQVIVEGNAARTEMK